MNILWIYDTYLNPEAGGTERMTSIISKGLTDDGHKCFGQMIVKPDSPFILNGEVINDLYNFLKSNKIDFVINQECRNTIILETFLTKGGNQWRKEGGKIISCLHFDTKTTNTLYHYKVKLSKTIFDYYSIVKAYILQRKEQKKIEQKLGSLYRWIYSNSDYFITLSTKFNPYFIKVTGLTNTSKLISINNPLTFDTISPYSLIDSKKKIVLICSRMDEYQKRISLALKIWSMVVQREESKGWMLKIVGTGNDLEYYKKYVIKNKIKNVKFEGRKNPDSYYKEASIFLMTSGFEGWGLTLTESLQRGVVPVVMNNCEIFSEIIEDGFNGFLTKKNSIKDCASHILLLMRDQKNLVHMQHNALESAKKYTLNKTMESWRKIIPNK